MGNSSFEHSFRRALNCVKANVNPVTGERHDRAPTFTAGDRTLVASVAVGFEGKRVYDFWQRAGTREDILGSLITISGPAYYERRQKWGDQKELVAFLEPGGKVKYQKPNRHTRDAVDEAVVKFWGKMGLKQHEAEGWDISSYVKDGSISSLVRVLRRKKNGLMEEYAVARPKPHGHSFDYYMPETAKGREREHLPFDKQKKIPISVGGAIHELMVREGYFNSGRVIGLSQPLPTTVHPRDPRIKLEVGDLVAPRIEVGGHPSASTYVITEARGGNYAIAPALVDREPRPGWYSPGSLVLISKGGEVRNPIALRLIEKWREHRRQEP